ncbi:MAG: hypothetical protein MUE85_03670 [Microscillaceae bacterium]|jgi:MFS family permease|nr:hypothetical protein [Microscillaceae bacterium]
MKQKKVQEDHFRKRWASLGMFAGPLVFLILLFFSLLIHEWKMSEVGYTAVVGIAGIIFGWAIGFLLAPETFKHLEFSRATIVILAFVGGYVFSKLEPILFFLFKENILLEKPSYGIRFMIFLICLSIATINMYVYRKYLDDFARWMQYDPEASPLSEVNELKVEEEMNNN